jgi:membrane-associated phospholipid phosphatase
MFNFNTTKLDFKKYEHAKYLLIIPLYMLIFCLEEKYIVTGYFISYLPLDDLIPFNEWFVIPYTLWYPLMLGTGAYLFFYDVKGFKQYMTFIGGGFLIIVLLYAIFPNGQNLRPTSFANSNILTQMVHRLYSSDTNTNVCPSLHVVGTMGAMFALLETKQLNRWWINTLNIFLAIMISISTVFIKQHSVLDLICGLAFGFIYYFAVYKLLPRFKFSTYRKQKKLHISH